MMMDIMLEQIIEKKLDLLADFIIEKNPNANKESIYRKIYQLNILNEDPASYPSPFADRRSAHRGSSTPRSGRRLGMGKAHRVGPKGTIPGDGAAQRDGTRITDSIEDQRPLIKVQRSDYSNYVLTAQSPRFDDLVENKLVMNINTHTIIGIENSKGEIEPLNKYLIEICHKYKLKFEMPPNLNVDDEIPDVVLDDDEVHKLGLSYKSEDEDEENDD